MGNVTPLKKAIHRRNSAQIKFRQEALRSEFHTAMKAPAHQAYIAAAGVLIDPSGKVVTRAINVDAAQAVEILKGMRLIERAITNSFGELPSDKDT